MADMATSETLGGLRGARNHSLLQARGSRMGVPLAEVYCPMHDPVARGVVELGRRPSGAGVSRAPGAGALAASGVAVPPVQNDAGIFAWRAGAMALSSERAGAAVVTRRTLAALKRDLVRLGIKTRY